MAVLAAVVTPSLSAGRFGSKAYFVEPAPYMDDAPVGMGGYRGFNSFIVRPAGSDPRYVLLSAVIGQISGDKHALL